MSNWLLMPTMATIENGETLGAWLRAKRRDKGLSITELLVRMGNIVTKATISLIETDKMVRRDGRLSRIDKDLIDAWADALGESRNKLRKKFDYSEKDDEMLGDEVLEEFTYSLARYRRLPESMRPFFVTGVNQLADFLIDIDATNKRESKLDGPERQAEDRAASDVPAEIPVVSIEEIETGLGVKKKKGPPKQRAQKE